MLLMAALGSTAADAALSGYQLFTDQYGADAQTRQVALADVRGPGTEYLRELNKVATGEVTYGAKAELLNVEYQEVTKQAGVLTKAAIALITQNPWAAFALNTAADGIISGKIDLENVVKDAAFTFVTAGFGEYASADGFQSFQGITGELTSSINLSTTGLGGGKYFSEQWLAASAIDAGVTGAAQTAIYGGNMGDNIARDFGNSVINESTAVLFNEIGNVKDANHLTNGSLPGALLKGTVGCLSSEASGGTCASGFIVSSANEFASPFYDDGYVEDPNATAEQKERARKTYELDQAYKFGVITGALASGGDVSNIGRGSNLTTSAVQNNRQLHVNEAMTIRLYADEYAAEQCQRGLEFCISTEMAKAELATETLRGVSDDFARVKENVAARNFLNSLNIAGTAVDGQTLFGVLDRDSYEYQNSTINMANFDDGYDAPSILDLYVATNISHGQNGAVLGISGAAQDFGKYKSSYTTEDLRQMMEGGFYLARTYEQAAFEHGPGWSKSGKAYDPQAEIDDSHVANLIDWNLGRGVGYANGDLWSNPYPDQAGFNVFAYYHDRNLKGMASAAGGMAIGLARGGMFKDLDIGKAFGKNATKGGVTGNSSVDVFVNTRTGGNPRTNVDGEAGHPVGPQGRVFNAQELDSFAPTLAQRNPIRLSDGLLIDNQGFVYTRNGNGSVTSRVASSDQLAQSGQRLDFDNISTANSRQSVTARNQNEQLALDQVRANPSGGQPLAGLNNDARFTSYGFEKMTQSVPGPSGRNVNIHYQYNPATGRVVDVKINSPLTNAQ